MSSTEPVVAEPIDENLIGSRSTSDKRCTCPTSKLFPHRASKCAGRKLKASLAPGINFRNDTDKPVLVVLSQLTPLHWTRVEPGQTVHVDCGRVFFTISVEYYNKDTVPTEAGVAARLAAITAATVGFGLITGVALVGSISAVTSYKPVKVDGVLADGKLVAVASRRIEDNVEELFFSKLEL